MFLSHIYNNFIYTPSTKNSISEEFQAQNTRASTTIQLCMCPKRNSRQFVIYYMYPWITQLFNWQGVCGCGWNTHMQGKNQISIKWTFECKTWTLIIGYIIIDFPYVELAKTSRDGSSMLCQLWCRVVSVTCAAHPSTLLDYCIWTIIDVHS
jgi:hypothetical protein